MQVSLVLPLKSLERAKERLSAALDLAQRQMLCLTMLEDVLLAARACAGVKDIWLLTGDGGLARERNLQHIPDPGGDLNDAVTRAAKHLRGLDYQDMLVLHTDLPLLETAELDELIRAHGELRTHSDRCLSIASDLRGTGSNALLCSPPGALSFAYGEGSLGIHLDRARAGAIEAQALHLSSIAMDIDTVEDFAHLKERLQEHPGGAPRTSQLIGSWDG